MHESTNIMNEAFQHQTFYDQNTCKCCKYGGSENKSLSSKPSGFTLQCHTICQVNLLVFCEISNCSNGTEKPKISMINNKAKCLKPWQLPGFWTSLSNIPKIILKRTGYVRVLRWRVGGGGGGGGGGGVPPLIRQKTAISIFVPMVDPHRPDHVTWPHFHPVYFELKDGGRTFLWIDDQVLL